MTGGKIYLVAVAGGSGTRMHSTVPKQFMEIREKAILQRTIEKFTSACPGIKVVTVLPEAHIPYWKEYCLSRNFSHPQTLVHGGVTRFHSVRAALEKVPDGAVVAIHDGVRPLVSASLIRSMVARMDSCRALIPVLPVTDTLKALRPVPDGDDGRRLVRIEGREIDRSEVFAAQTPQIFRSEDIKAAYAQPYDTSFTDDASVAERFGIPLEWCLGEKFNLKITTPEDLILAEAIIRKG
jgi:2-C-methyl-D-erythritol 4-phosphate cytidylyltransferase